MRTTKIIAKSIALAALIVLSPSCDKRKIEAPEPDKEFQSSVDASYALQVISDIEMICSHTGENDVDETRFFWEVPGTIGTNVVTFSRDTVKGFRRINVSFNDALCRDGHKRSGTISMFFDTDVPNTYYFRNPFYVGKVSLINYKIDDWSVSLRNDFTIKNLAPINYDPKKTNLSWSLNGDFDLKHPSDAKKNIHTNVDLVKTLKNTSDAKVFPNKLTMINWHLSVVEYTGNMFGEVSGNVPFKYAIKDSKPLTRDFQCAPENVKNIVGTEFPRSPYQQSHPFVDGIGEFTPSDKYPRVIYYGSEDGSAPSCDNSGVIMIKGISYPIDFEKVYENK